MNYSQEEKFYPDEIFTNIGVFVIIPLLCFLLGLLFIHPVMFFNDEWITGNQLNQLSHGSQILYNEGKYGTYENGTLYTYFEIRHNSLPYTSYEPLFSLPFLWFIIFIGDNLPFVLILLWMISAIILYLFVSKFLTLKLSMRSLILLMLFVFFISNLIFYKQIPLSHETDSWEIIAVVLYHICIFALLSVVIYLINLALFSHPLQVLFGTVASICCSSDLFWVTNLKDHLDVMFFVALLVYSIILHLKTRDDWFGIVTFILSGFIIWVRPEYGVFTFLSLLIVYWPLILINKYGTGMKQVFISLISPGSTFIGVFPLFLNNYLVMGNPLKMPWQMVSDYVVIPDEAIKSSGTTISNSGLVDSIISIFHNIYILFLHRMTPGGDLMSGLYSAFLYPESLKVPVFALTPIFLLSVFLLPILVLYMKKRVEREEKMIIIILLSLSVATVIAYMSSISGLGTSNGIFPDVRYLSPLYLPLTLIGLIVLMKFDLSSSETKSIIKNIAVITVVVIVGVIVITTGLHQEYGYSDFFLWINAFTTLLVFITLGITFIVFSSAALGIISDKYRWVPLCFLIAFPIIWQLSQLIIINFSGNIFDQYPPLLPAVRALSEYISGSTIG
jgi:hypothetical protein